MASPNPTYTEIVTTTIENRQRKLADNVTEHNALLRHLKSKGQIKTTSGGRVIVEELEYAENSTFQRYSGYEVLDISPSDIMTAAEFNWKQYAVNVTYSGLEAVIQNAGKEKFIDLVASRIRNAEKTMANNLAVDIYSDGTATSGKQIGGLELLVADSPTSGTVGGIDRGTYSWWQNNIVNTSTITASNIQTYMNQLWIETVRGADTPDLMVFDDAFFRLYWESLQANQRFTSDRRAAAGFTNILFMDQPVFFEKSGDGGIAANHGYFLNTDYIRLRVHPQRNMTPLREKTSVNQDATVIPILWAGNMTISNSARQGVLKNP
ncbi:phage major capsid protein [Marinibaculum pumilum]|uniref:Phage major capsid protein n=1 Tax=Marinibaculum pumilum TaxID=1766165 RepID=A0ABV7L2E4_9PROT